MNCALLSTLCLSLSLLVEAQYTVQPRWGQATLLLQNSLIIHGGKTDPSNGQSYTSAPDNAEVLYLDLSSSFNAASAPWQLVNGPSNDSSVQGPSVAWHTINAVNTSHALLFGGVPDANGQPPVVGLPDSAAIFDAYNRLSPTFSVQPSQWAGQPARRIRHTGVSGFDGKVYIIGGEKPDNANSAYADNYIFDVNGPSFTQLPSGLPDLTGHCSLILPNGWIVVLGGYSPSSNKLQDFSALYILDTTQSTLAWSTMSTTGTPPSGRRAFACALYGDHSIYIHGGSDGSHQTVYSDGWLLDLSQSTWTWSSVSALSQLGSRSDHFAVSTGNEIIFGFGYGSSAPSATALQIFHPSGSGSSGSGGNSGSGGSGSGSGSDSGGGSWSDSHTPSSSSGGDSDGGSSLTLTVPGPSGTPHVPTNTGIGSSTGAIHPTSTQGQGSDDPLPADQREDNAKDTTAIAVGTALGLLAALAVAAVVTHRVRKRRRMRRQFHALAGDDENIPPAGLPAAGPPGEKYSYSRRHALLHDDPTQGGLGRDIIAALGVPALAVAVNKAISKSTVTEPERRDMLADEDTRDFGLGAWYANQVKTGTGGSSWSLRSVFGGRMRREGSTASSVPQTPWEKVDPFVDPFSDGTALLRDNESGYHGALPIGAAVGASRPGYSRRQSSYASSFSYTDPFADPFVDPQPRTYANVGATSHHHRRDTSDGTLDMTEESEPTRPYRQPLQPPVTELQTTLPITMEPHTLSPLTEASSRGTLAIPSGESSSSHQSHAHTKSSSFDRSTNKSPFDTLGSSSHGHESGLTNNSRVTSMTSIYPTPSSPPPGAQSPFIPSGAARSTSMIDANQPRPDSGGVKRSDTWWARLAKTSIPRRGSLSAKEAPSNVGSAAGMFEFRDPHPPPARLGAIAESQYSVSPEDHSPQNSKGSTKPPSRRPSGKLGAHGKSMSSLRTLDSDAMERLGGMDVVQRIRTGSESQKTRDSSYDSRASSHLRRGSSLAEEHGYWIAQPGEQDREEITMSPTEVVLPESIYASSSSAGAPSRPPSHATKSASPFDSPADSAASTPSEEQSSRESLVPGTSGKKMRPPSGGAVAARVQAYEKRMSMDLSPPPAPTNTRAKEEKKGPNKQTTTYGLVPRASLYVANPDRKQGSGDS